MKTEIILQLTKNFEEGVNKTEDNLEFWFARDLQYLLGYAKWENFISVINKAKTSCEVSGEDCQDHFPDIRKTIPVPNVGSKEIEDFALTRYACYLITQNGDPSKEEIAFAQTYFAIQTRNAEIIADRISQVERLQARKKLTETEKELSRTIYLQTGGNNNFATIRSKGDAAFFGDKTARNMKIVWNTGEKPIADFMPTILLKAKDFASEITIHNAKLHNMRTEKHISDEHVTNNKSVRNTLVNRGIVPERLKPSDDIKKIERRINSQDKKDVKMLQGKKGKII
jgi:DNA-damage-inducible protein D